MHESEQDMWEVGVHIMIPHHSGDTICPTLQWHQNVLEQFQKATDAQEINLFENQRSNETSGTRTRRAGGTTREEADILYKADMTVDAELAPLNKGSDDEYDEEERFCCSTQLHARAFT